MVSQSMLLHTWKYASLLTVQISDEVLMKLLAMSPKSDSLKYQKVRDIVAASRSQPPPGGGRGWHRWKTFWQSPIEVHYRICRRHYSNSKYHRRTFGPLGLYIILLEDEGVLLSI